MKKFRLLNCQRPKKWTLTTIICLTCVISFLFWSGQSASGQKSALSLNSLLSLTNQRVYAQAESEERESSIHDSNRYELYPIAYEPDLNQTPTHRLMESLVFNQGYEVHCAAQEWEISPEFYNERYAELFFNYYPNNSADFEGAALYELNVYDAKVPTYRSNIEESLTTKTSSYEAFFGTLMPHLIIDSNDADSSDLTNVNPSLDNRNYDTTKSGVANHLLTPAQQCQVKFENLIAVHSICLSLHNPAECHINTTIPNTNINRWELYGEMEDLVAPQLEPDGTRKENYGDPLSCKELMNNWNALQETLTEGQKQRLNKYQVDETKFNNIQQAINNMSLDIENLYRIAFLVIVPEQDPRLSEQDTASFYDQGENEVSQSAPLFIAFKVPDFMANRSWHRDSSLVTRWALTSKAQQQEDLKKIDEQRTGNYGLALERLDPNKRFQPEDPINCQGSAVCERNEKNPDSVIKNALVDMINALANDSCQEELIFEKAGDIYTPAFTELKKTPHDTHLDIYPSDKLVKEDERSFKWSFKATSLQEYKRGFQNNDLGDGETPAAIKVNAYIVAPLGLEQELLFDALLGFFFSPEDALKLKEENLVMDSFRRGVYPEYLTMPGAEFGLNPRSDVGKFSFVSRREEDCEDIWLCFNPVSNLLTKVDEDQRYKYDNKPYPCFKDRECKPLEFGKGIYEDRPDELSIFGAKVGWVVRKIQESISTTGTKAHAYFSSCNRIEDMFLGRCGYDEEFFE